MVAQYESDLADFQLNLIEKGDNILQTKYYKTDPVEYQYIQQELPPYSPIPPSIIDTIGDIDTIESLVPGSSDEYLLDKTGGYGTTTVGRLQVTEGSVKAFGTFGQSIGASNKGYIHPAEEGNTCIDKFVAIIVVPVDNTFVQSDDDELQITVESEAAFEPALTQSAFDGSNFKFETNDALADEYSAYAQNQELAEFLGAKYIAGAAASVATMAAMTLF